MNVDLCYLYRTTDEEEAKRRQQEYHRYLRQFEEEDFSATLRELGEVISNG